ncbi:glutamate ABC transporter substrate-binding protein [Haloechinothrix halophila]|uniref:Amino acid ABC transporter substrate-binding protein, PAAT family n=1 Tax=Haloechinothrix halophila YIM 93223 TaxID=592678 RepID=W9DMA2_9PSEU|nr:glutamate ABC transporter substrate-binding protein [Haloechinothrix halophila]ETA66589.1 amino acid ABC transporter substrate-binding protein, PAAT family [Haloechinothrix halophila YIM 93223]
MSSRGSGRLAAVLAALLAGALLLAGCGSAGEPPNLAPHVQAQRPTPANAEVSPEIDSVGSVSEDCGDPTASLRPKNGLATPPGSTMAEIKKRGILRVGVDQNTFLFGFRNPTTGNLEGFDIAIAREIAKALFGDPDRVRFKAITSQQRIDVLRDGTVDVVVRTMTINCERREQIEFSSVYFVAGQRVLVTKRSGYSGLADLAGKKVCATTGSTSLRNIAAADSEPIPVAVENWSDCLVLLQQGQVEAISTDDTILAGMAQQDPTTHVVGPKFTNEPYGVGIPKEDTDLVRYVNAVLQQVRKNTWQAVYDRWIEPALGPGTPPEPTYK